MEHDVIQKGKALAVISYFGILAILPFLIQPNNAYAVSHGRQGLCIFAWFVVATFFSIIPFIGPIFWTFSFIACMVLMVLGIIHAITGRTWVVPVVGKFFAVEE
ncbi:MAG: hypothetical protein HQK84_08985 [Nitrospinae bacterium]|nr:hypothetical protein [Nitrospinota bacterium]